MDDIEIDLRVTWCRVSNIRNNFSVGVWALGELGLDTNNKIMMIEIEFGFQFASNSKGRTKYMLGEIFGQTAMLTGQSCSRKL